MNLLFPFASLGVINGVLVSVYLLFKRGRSISDIYFSGLILSICIRIGKSVLLYYTDPTDPLILQLGLSACIFIGPFFYLYLKSVSNRGERIQRKDRLLLASLFIIITGIGWIYPYKTFPEYWNPEIVQVIYGVWAIFIILGTIKAYTLLGNQLFMPWKLKGDRQYLASIVIAVLLITITYQLALYVTSFTYIWGAFIFSGSFYVLGFRALRNKTVAAKPPTKSIEKSDEILNQLNRLMKDEKPFLNQELKMDDLAKRLGISRHVLSQVLNETSANGYNNYIKSYRVEEAKELISTNEHLSLEGIGYESGFKSKSSFFDAFKKIEDCTPAEYKKRVK